MKILLLLSSLILLMVGYLELNQQMDADPSLTCQSIETLTHKLYDKHVTSLHKAKPYNIYYKELVSESLDEYLNELDPFRVVFSKKQFDKIESYNKPLLPIPGLTNKISCDELVYIGLMFDKQLGETLKLVDQVEAKGYDFVLAKLKEENQNLSTADSQWSKNVQEKEDNLKLMYTIAFDDIRKTTDSDKEAWIVAQRIVRRRLNELHVDSEGVIVNKIMKGLLGQMDAHSRFFSESEFEDAMKSLMSTFVGVGIVVAEVEKGYKVTEVIEGGPAEQQKKLKVGDIIARVDGQDVQAQPRTRLAELLSGPDSSTVQLEIIRLGRTYDLEVIRGAVRSTGALMESKVKTVGGRKLGLIKLSHFYADDIGSGGAADDFKRKLLELTNKNGVEGLIIDLRGNGGGILTEVIKIAGMFINSGPIVFEYGTVQKKYESYDDLDGQTYFNGPLVVLVDSSSASAAEILAGSLKDYNRAVVVGSEQSYGKGTIQEIGPLENIWAESPIKGAVKITIGYYYLPLGESVQFQGVKSDIVFPEVVAEDKEMEKSLKNALEHPESIKLATVLDKVRKWTPDIQFTDLKKYLLAEYRARQIMEPKLIDKKEDPSEDKGANLGFQVLADMTNYYERNMPGQLAAKTTAQLSEKQILEETN